MKLDRLHMFHSQIQEELFSEGIEAHLYYYFDGKWYDLVMESHCDEGKSGPLERAKKDPVSYHSSNSLNAWFHFSDTNCVVKLAFPKSPQKATRCQYRERLLKIQKSALNAYNVSHNQLTHLPLCANISETFTSH